jgi:hypothetical protein
MSAAAGWMRLLMIGAADGVNGGGAPMLIEWSIRRHPLRRSGPHAGMALEE